MARSDDHRQHVRADPLGAQPFRQIRALDEANVGGVREDRAVHLGGIDRHQRDGRIGIHGPQCGQPGRQQVCRGDHRAGRADRHRGLPFALTWWSFTFPVGTCVTGTIALAARSHAEALRGASVVLYAFLLLAWLVVAARTAHGATTGLLLGPMPPPEPESPG